MDEKTKKSTDFVENVRRKTRRYVNDDREENGMLRQQIEVLECDKHLLAERVLNLEDELRNERSEREKLYERLATMEQMRASSAEEYAMVEEQNNNLAHLYSATYSLHGSLDREELLNVIKEIVANLLGSEEMGIFELDENGRIQLVASLGLEHLETAAWEEGVIGETVHAGRSYLPNDDDGEPPANDAPTACVPLKIGECTVGALAIFGLLGQKAGLDPLDYELLDLLGNQAAMALHCATLRSQHVESQGS